MHTLTTNVGNTSANIVMVRMFAQIPFMLCYQAMLRFVMEGATDQCDEIWFTEHAPVYTLGTKGRGLFSATHIANIPLLQTDRGGNITYHGPGQIIIYPLLKLRRGIHTIKQVVLKLQKSVANALTSAGIADVHLIESMPGVYIRGQKICSIGLRVRNNYTMHGLALNFNMDLAPFNHINPCGYKGLNMTHVYHYLPSISKDEILALLASELQRQLGYDGLVTTAQCAPPLA